MSELTSDNPYTRQHWEQLKEAQRRLNALIPNCDRAERCGMDVTPWRALIDYYNTTLQAFEREFMTPPPK